MTDRQFLKRMFDLTVRLTDAVENDGYRSDAYNEVHKEISECAAKFNRRRRRRSWFAIAIICLVLLMLACIVYSILL
ncbi:hypothetical protein ES703_91793 [subsurface metagenome]